MFVQSADGKINQTERHSGEPSFAMPGLKREG